MQTHGQFCAIARALELVGDRWTLLVVRELLLGSTRFGELRAGIPRISRTMLATRLASLVDEGIVARTDAPAYHLTERGRALEPIVIGLGVWGQRHARWPLRDDELDADVLLFDVRRRIARERLPKSPVVLRIVFRDLPVTSRIHFLLLRRDEVSLCAHNPGFPTELTLTTDVRTLTAFWRGDITWDEAKRQHSLTVEGSRTLVRALPTWFERYLLADVSAEISSGVMQ